MSTLPFNHEAEKPADDKLTPWGLDMTSEQLQDKVRATITRVSDGKDGGKTSELAEGLEQDLSVREMSTLLSLMVAERISDSLPSSFEEFAAMLANSQK